MTFKHRKCNIRLKKYIKQINNERERERERERGRERERKRKRERETKRGKKVRRESSACNSKREKKE